MRWQYLLAAVLSLLAISLDQSPVVGQCIPGVARSCGGCGPLGLFTPYSVLRRPWNGSRGSHCASPCLPMPLPCAPPCTTAAPRMRPQRVVNWEMVPQTVCRQQPYCETVPVTTYRQVVVNVPQTEYRTVMRYQTVAEQVMVPQRRVNTVWVPSRRPRTLFMPPQAPCYTGGCTDFGMQNFGYSGEMSPSEMIYSDGVIPDSYQGQPMLTVPNAPQLDQKVPAPMQDPMFQPTNPDNSNTYYSPWQMVPSYGQPAYEQYYRQPQPYYEATADRDGYRTIEPVPRSADLTPTFIPATPRDTTWR